MSIEVTSTRTDDDTMDVRVSLTIRVELKRVDWSYITDEDYFVRLQPNDRLIGVVGAIPGEHGLWRVYGGGDPRWGGRKYASRSAATAALVRWHIKRNGV